MRGAARGPRSRARAPARLSSEPDVSRVHRLRARCDAILVGVQHGPLRRSAAYRAACPRGAQGGRRRRRHRQSAHPDRTGLYGENPARLEGGIDKPRDQNDNRGVRNGARAAHPGSAADGRGGCDDGAKGSRRAAALESSGKRRDQIRSGGGRRHHQLGISPQEPGRRDCSGRIPPTCWGAGLRGAVSLVEGPGFPSVSGSPKLSLRSARRLGDHVILSYDVGAWDGDNGSSSIRRPRRAGSRT